MWSGSFFVIMRKISSLALLERRNSLAELAKIVGSDDALYEKMVVGMMVWDLCNILRDNVISFVDYE